MNNNKSEMHYKRKSKHFIAQVKATGYLEDFMHFLHILVRDGSEGTGALPVIVGA